MTSPRLIAISGLAEGQTFALSNDETSIGRDSGNLICIKDHSLSRRHCLIKRENDSFRVVDLESYNGTFVNAVPVGEQILNHGDHISVGGALFIFLTHELEADSNVSRVELSDDAFQNHSTIRLAREDARYLQPAKLPESSRVASDLNALLKISTVLGANRSLAELQPALLMALMEAIPAERGAILLVKPGSEEVLSSYGMDKNSGAQQTILISRSVAEKSLRERVGILCCDVKKDESFRVAESLLADRVCSLLCVPLAAGEQVTGLIYLDTNNPATVFDVDHLQLLTAVGSVAALAIENVQRLEWLEDENQRLRREVSLEHNMIGESPRIQDVYRSIERVAPSDATVLITGESGTGKELVAHAIHANSERAKNPFIAINCAILSESLLESELFGYEKGAFTSAVAQKRGRLELADGGTVFLDEVGELTPSTQSKLLRVLQEREFERLGGTRTIKIDVRIIAATNRKLESAIREGTFRQDLYYRLNVISLAMPPLRERREDIPLLAYYFLAKYSRKCKRLVNGISPEARACLIAYDWPGNVRELENAIERAVVLGNTDVIVLDDLPESLLANNPAPPNRTNYHEAVNEMKKQFILRAIEEANGSYTEAAKALGIHPTNLHRLIRNLDLRGLIDKGTN